VTEPTPEQIDKGRERAREIIESVGNYPDDEEQAFAVEAIATALATRAIEARDEALREAEEVASVLGRCVCNHCEHAVRAIRALRGTRG